MFLNSLHYCLLNKPILFTCAAFENGSHFLTVPWESVAGLQKKSRNLLLFFLVCSTFSSSSVAVLLTAILSLFLNFLSPLCCEQTYWFSFHRFLFHTPPVKATILISTLGNHTHPSRKAIFYCNPFPKH